MINCINNAENQQNTNRDYDKEPIVINDYNPLFAIIPMITMIPIMICIYIYNPGGTSTDSLFRHIFIIIPLMMYPSFKGYFKARGKRKIILSENEITFLHENIELERIALKDITDIRKTYSDIYHKSQYLSEIARYIAMPIVIFILLLIKKLYFILLIPFLQIALIMNKFFFHLHKNNYKTYRLFDAIMVFDGEKFINIFLSTNIEYNDVQQYFIEKGFGNIENKKIFFEFFGHGYEKINLETER